MIITKIYGGLGNQLFQYALGKSLALKNNTPLKLDISFFEQEQAHVTYRKYGLSDFNINAVIATAEEVNKIKRNHLKGLFKSIYWRLQYRKPYYKQNYIKEKSFTFDNNILNSPQNIYLDGYWQSPKYFENIRNILLKELSLKNPLNISEQQYFEKIQNTNSVSIHVRRGDYISNPKHTEIYAQLGMNYYNSAIAYIKEKVEKPSFFIFSDDMDWVKTNFKTIENCIFIDSNNAAHSLSLMSACKHNIIANSTFSWWGAWLNYNEYKIVIVPQKWFVSEKINKKDMCPESWLAI